MFDFRGFITHAHSGLYANAGAVNIFCKQSDWHIFFSFSRVKAKRNALNVVKRKCPECSETEVRVMEDRVIGCRSGMIGSQ